MKKVLAIMATCLALTACGKDTQRVGREFSSMSECLRFIEVDVGERLRVLSDKPGDISGKSDVNELFFRCEAKMTGTRGLVLEGRWDRLRK